MRRLAIGNTRSRHRHECVPRRERSLVHLMDQERAGQIILGIHPHRQAGEPYTKRSPPGHLRRSAASIASELGLGTLELPTSRLSDTSRALVSAGNRGIHRFCAGERWPALVGVVVDTSRALVSAGNRGIHRFCAGERWPALVGVVVDFGELGGVSHSDWSATRAGERPGPRRPPMKPA